MEKIEVTTRFTKDGVLIPLEFQAGDKNFSVLNIGRRWMTADGQHILVMDFSEETHHLFLQTSDFSWYLIKDFKTTPGNI